jgi:hypothetical protein
MMLPVKIQIEAEELFPLDHRQGGIQRIEVDDLNVSAYSLCASPSVNGAHLRKWSRCCGVLVDTLRMRESALSVP